MEANWTSLCLADCGTWLSGGTPSKSQLEYWHGDIPWVSPKDMNERFIKDAQDHISLMGVNNGSRLVPPHTILFVVRSMTLAHKFQIAITERAVAFNQDLKAIVCKENVYPYFLFYSLLSQSNTILQLVDEASHGTKRLRTEVLEKLNISLPPLAEQCRIAHFFKALDDKIELNRQMNNTLESIAQALFKSWFVDFDPVRAKMEGRQPYGMDAETAELFPDGFEDSELGEIPRGWRVSQIGDEVRVVGGATPSTKEVMYWEGGNIHWATPKDLASLPNAVLLNTERCITESGLQQISSGLLPVGTVLLSSRAPIGYLAIAEIPVAINQGFIALICERELTNHYVLQWLRLNMDTVKSRANGTTFLEISKANFRPIPIAIPPKTILSRFNSQAKVIHQGIVNNLRQSETLSAIRDALLPKLLSGQIRVRDAEKMVESAV